MAVSGRIRRALRIGACLITAWIGTPARAQECEGYWESQSLGRVGSISSIASAPHGPLYVGIDGGGVRAYEPEGNGVYAWRSIFASKRAGLLSNNVRDVVVWGSELWVGTDLGISVLNLSTGIWRSFTTSNSPLPSNLINCLTVAPGFTGGMWISTGGGAARYRRLFIPPNPNPIETWTVLGAGDGLADPNVQDVAVHPAPGGDVVWIATLGGIYQFQDGSPLSRVRDTGECLMTGATSLAVDRGNNLWFGSLSNVPALRAQAADGGAGALVATGICRYQNNRAGITWTGYPDFLGFWANDLSTDSAGRLWCAFEGRATIHDQGTFCIYTEGKSPLFQNEVTAVKAVGEGGWFGFRNVPALSFHSPGWDRFNPDDLNNPDGVVRVVLVEDSAISVGIGDGVSQRTNPDGGWNFQTVAADGSPVKALVRGGDGSLWVATGGDGVYRSVGAGYEKVEGGGLPSPFLRAMTVDSQGRIWVGTAAGLALRANSYWLPFLPTTSDIGSTDIRALVVDPQDRIWVGTGDAGVYVLDTTVTEDTPWSRHDTSTGLPSNQVRSLAPGPQGGIWAATPAGAAFHDGNGWNVYDVQNGALPGADVLSVTVDPAARVWLGTTSGLALREADAWTHFHVPGTTLESDRVTGVFASADELWAVSGPGVSTRRVIMGPIGFAPPEIDSFTPTSGPPGTTVTISGKNFDDRGPSYNRVTFGLRRAGSNELPLPAVPVSVNPVEIVVRVPPLATSGKIRVTAHHLSAESADEFKVRPAISSVGPLCVSIGDKLTIYGGGFFGVAGGSFAEVKVGNGPWQVAESQTSDQIVRAVQRDDTSGLVSVRLANGTEVVSSQSVTVGQVSLRDLRIQQAIESLPIFWGKRTLVHIMLEATGCNARITDGRIFWRKKNGEELPAGWAYHYAPRGSTFLSANAPVDAARFGVDFVAEFESNRSGWSEIFPLSEFDGVRVVLTNRGYEVINFVVPSASFGFREVPIRPRLINMAVLAPAGVPGTARDDFWNDAWASLGHVARMLPLNDIGWRRGPTPWVVTTSAYTTRWPLVDIVDDDGNDFYNYPEIRDFVDDFLDPGFAELGMALIDGAIMLPGAAGRAPLGPYYTGKTAVSGVFGPVIGVGSPWSPTGPIIGQETLHMWGLNNEDSPNNDADNGSHSRFDEGEMLEAVTNCAADRTVTFREALKSQLGFKAKVVRLDEGAPFEHSLMACNENRPRSVMSYAPNVRNNNIHMEPVDYMSAIAYLDGLLQYSLLFGGGAGVDDKTLRVRGTVSMQNEIVVSVCYLEDSTSPPSLPNPDGPFRFLMKAADGSILAEHLFGVNFHAHDTADLTTRFSLGLSFPTETSRVEIRRGDILLWEKSVSANAPMVEIVEPTGGIFQAEDFIEIRWESHDADGDVLQFALDYTPDGGKTWHPMPQYLRSKSYSWQPLFVPPSDSARLRIRASDGFLTSTALSAPFTLESLAPIAIVRQPAEGAVFLENQRVDLCGESLTAHGANVGSFAWEVGGAGLEETRRSTAHVFDTIGPHTIRLVVTDPEGKASQAAEVSINVLADYDGDGMPNDFELMHRLNPLDFGDAIKDSDADGLSNRGEYDHGGDPRNPDSDGDGWTDGEEWVADTPMTEAGIQPSATPLLLVGAEVVGFTVRQGDPMPEPKSFWVNNDGAGNLQWTAQTDAPWLDVFPPQGAAPIEVEFAALVGATGVDTYPVGTYRTTVVFDAPGAANSPHTVNVHMHVLPAVESDGPRFVRGDCDGDGEACSGVNDALILLSWLFQGKTPPPCRAACDADGTGVLELTDAVYGLDFCFKGLGQPVSPFPDCGEGRLPRDGTLGCATEPAVCR